MLMYWVSFCLSKRDVVLYFSYSGATHEVLEAAEVIRSRGAKLILVTRYLKGGEGAALPSPDALDHRIVQRRRRRAGGDHGQAEENPNDGQPAPPAPTPIRCCCAVPMSSPSNSAPPPPNGLEFRGGGGELSPGRQGHHRMISLSQADYLPRAVQQVRRPAHLPLGQHVVGVQEYENFTRSERKIADYVLEHQKETQYISITES